MTTSLATADERLPTPDERLATVDSLVREVREGNAAEAQKLLCNLLGTHESHLYEEMGKLTRRIHDAMRDFQLDARLNNLATTELPDAKSRLDYVVGKTEESAHRTLDAVERIMPISERLGEDAERVKSRWLSMQRRGMGDGELCALSRDIREFIDAVKSDARHIATSLTDVLMAQEYQDLTGQVLRRVTALMQEVEGTLVELLSLRGGVPCEGAGPGADKRGGLEAEGPQVDTTRHGVVSGQADVDDLLSSLGF